MKTILKTSVIALLFTVSLTEAQERKVKQATDNFNNYAYAEAIESYESLVAQGYSDVEIYKNLGNANYFNANYDEAAKWYEKLFAVADADAEPEYLYRYSQTLKSQGDYIKSGLWIEKLEMAKEMDLRASKYVNNEDYLADIKAASGRYEIKNLGINSSASDFAPSINGEQLVFSTARDSGLIAKRIHNWNNSSFLNLYRADILEDGSVQNASKLNSLLNKKTHESSTAFTKDGNTMYFTRNNSNNGNFSRDDEGVSRLKVYRATLNNGTWGAIEELPFNGDSFSVAHPALSADESKLYFASDMAGTLGASDIFVVDINGDGSFGEPRNLGPKINTESRETFPFITASNVLYFASDGHPGLGGLDVFATNLNESDPIFVVNLGTPVNSMEDDFSFIINEANRKGYFASNRKEGKGDDDIYSFTENEPIALHCKTLIAGIVRDHETGEVLADSNLSLFDDQNRLITETLSDNNGAFSLDGDCADGDYKLVAARDAYKDGNQVFFVHNSEDRTNIEIALEKERKGAPIGTDLITYLGLEPIYFDFDEHTIRKDAVETLEKILVYLETYRNQKIEIRSHTDARGDDTYNMLLSNNRAKATAEYLFNKGIDANVLSYKGFGETQLVNHCANGTVCSKEAHQSNRRSEFMVVE